MIKKTKIKLLKKYTKALECAGKHVKWHLNVFFGKFMDRHIKINA